MPKIELNPEFKQALSLAGKSQQNIFITGKAGTGKSTLLEYFRDHNKKSLVVLAPTGVAALNVHGETIHSFFRFKPNITLKEVLKSASKADKKLFQKLDAIVIDEISMVRADLLDCIDLFLQTVRKNKEAFGGLQMIMIGDLYQLPPVVTKNDKEFFTKEYASPYFFDAKVMQGLGSELQIIELQKIYRQSDQKFIELLNAIRNRSVTDSQITKINKRVDLDCGEKDEGYIYLTTVNKSADEINSHKLSKLAGKTQRFTAETNGSFPENSYPTDPKLQLKIGARVMFLNNDSGGDWVNGSLGKVIEFADVDDESGVIVELADGEEVEVFPHTWDIYHSIYDKKAGSLRQEPVGSFTQIPLRLSWAITIHKSQGKTFDKVIIDLGRGTFAHGQSYVALSRCRTFEGMILKSPMKKSHVIMDWRVPKFLTGRKYEESEKACSLDDKVEIIKKAIKNKSKLSIVYLKAQDVRSSRLIRPSFVGELEYADKPFLGMEARCLLRNADRVFRVDRILEIEVG